MGAFDISLNMMSAFGFIIVLGIVVDDAIVTGENVYKHLQFGDDGLYAAIEGTREVAVPVTFGILTTIVAFMPLMFIEGFLGTWYSPVAMVVIPVLLFSLVESKLILPAHLAKIKPRPEGAKETGFTLEVYLASSLVDAGLLYRRIDRDVDTGHQWLDALCILPLGRIRDSYRCARNAGGHAI
jgi:multidrug efflux pump subunit AcrB